MPTCRTVTLEGLQASLELADVQATTTGKTTYDVTFTVANNGGASGTANVNMTVDIGLTGSTDQTADESVTVDAGSSVTRTKSFSVPDAIGQTQVETCTELQ